MALTLPKFQQDGTGAVNRDVKDKLKEFVSVKDFGAVGDGVTDDTVAFQNAINAAYSANAALDIGNANVAYSGNITLLDGSVLISSTKNGILTRTGTSRLTKTDISVASTLTLAATVANGDDTVQLDAASYANVNVGDFIRLSSDSTPFSSVYPLFESATSTQLNDITDDIFKEQVVKVLSKESSNTIRFEGTSLGNYFMGTAVVVKLANYYNSIEIDGITFVNSSTAESTVAENCPINLFGVYNLTVTNCNFELNEKSAGIIFMYGSAYIKGNAFNSANQTAIFLIRSVNSSVLSENTFVNQMGGDSSLFISTSCFNIDVTNNSFYGSKYKSLPFGSNYIAAIDLSARSNTITVTGNTFNGYNVGVRLLFGSYKNVISNNTFQNCNSYGVYLGNAPYNTVLNNVMTNCATLNDTLAAVHNVTSDYISVLSNSITSNTPVNELYTSGKNTVCIGNIFYNAIEILFNTSNGIFAQNEIINLTTGGYAFTINGATAHYNRVSSNLISITNGITAIRIANGSECNTIINNTCKLETGTLIVLASTSNAQSITGNTNIKASGATVVFPANVTISAPVMPTNADMPRNFRIYSTNTNAAVSQGTTYWEYNISDTDTTNHRFSACALTVTPVILP